jgi:anti-anti-sigma factor
MSMAELLSSIKQGNEGIIHIGGQLREEESTARLEQWLEEHFVDDGVTTIRIDLTAVTDMDLEGAAALGMLAAEAVKQHKVLVVEGATGRVRRKLEETGLARYLSARNDRGSDV